ncbi:MAG: hypothetical protein P8016_17215 [Sedimentisphaerales bacterium]
MSSGESPYSKFSYDEHAKTCAPDDFLGQVRRTVNGEPLSDEHISEYLIGVAKKNFEKLPEYQFTAEGVVEYIRQEKQAERFTKMLCYAGFQYFRDHEVEEIFDTILNKFHNVKNIFIGNLPDRARAYEFYKSRIPSGEELSDPQTAIGVWRNKDEFKRLANRAGWAVEFTIMPDGFHASYYRYDAFLSRQD